MVGTVLSATPLGFESQLIEVESDLSNGLPALHIVGLGNKAIEESKERVRSAIKNARLDFPKGKIVVNLAPAELPKDGVQFDLPIALSILCLGKQLSADNLSGALFAGELSLDGTLRPIKSSLAIAEAAKQHGITTVYLPALSANQAALVDGLTIYPVTTLTELYLHLKGEQRITPLDTSPSLTTAATALTPEVALDDIYGQEQAKRAIAIAVAGRHNILLSGSPGAGKTLLAKALNGLLPPLTKQEMIDVTKLHSLADGVPGDIIRHRPFRTPHHTASRTAMIGGGTTARPGEISLAHHGTLFLDELLEYPRATLEALRQPIEDRTVSISRVNNRYTYPAHFVLVATMNPCPCGYLGDATRECRCSSTQILNYQKRLSGPLLDRIDLTVTVARVPHETLLAPKEKQTKKQQKAYASMIAVAITAQNNRYDRSDVNNGSLTSTQVERYLPLAPDVRHFLLSAAKSLDLSTRSYFKLIKVARTIADLDRSADITQAHLAEALSYRQLAS